MQPQLKYLKPEEIQLGDNVRSKITKDSVASLSQSIREQGLLQPLLVMKDDNKYKLIAGFRRFAAAKLAELKNIPVQIMDIENTEEAQLVENLQREDLGPIDEAKAYQKLLTDHTLDDMTIMIGRGKWYVQQRLSLLSLAPRIKEAIAKGILSPGHGTTIARLKNHKQQIELMKMVISDRMSVKQTESNLGEFMSRLENAPFDKTKCKDCVWNGSKHKDLFDEDSSLKGQCLNKDCYELKVKTHLTERKADLIKKGIQVIARDKFYSGDKEFSKAKPIHSYDISDIGEEAFKENCLKPCGDIAVVLDRDGSETYYCLKPSCWKRQARVKYTAERKATKTSKGGETPETKASTDDLRQGRRVDETQRRFLLDKIRRLINDDLMTAVSLEALFAHEHGNNKSIAEFFKKAGICQKSKPNWEFRNIINNLYSALTEKKRKEGIFDCVSRRLEVYATDELVGLGKAMKVTMDQFRVDEEYLSKWTKAGLVRLCKHLGLKPDKDLEKKPKGEIVAYILKQKPGKAPKELC